MRLPARPADHPVPRRRTLRLRITALYGVPFLLSGIAMLAMTNVLARSGAATATAAVPIRTDVDPSAALAEAQSRIASQQAADLHQFLVGSVIALGVMVVVSRRWAGWSRAGCCGRCGR